MTNKRLLADLLRSPIDRLPCLTEEEGCEDMSDDYKQLRREMAAYVQSSQAFETSTAEKVTQLRDDICEIKAGIKELNEGYNRIWAKLTNGITDGLSRHEAELSSVRSNAITKDEFNGAMGSMRREIHSMKWFVATLVSIVLAIVGVMGGAVFL